VNVPTKYAETVILPLHSKQFQSTHIGDSLVQLFHFRRHPIPILSNESPVLLLLVLALFRRRCLRHGPLVIRLQSFRLLEGAEHHEDDLAVLNSLDGACHVGFAIADAFDAVDDGCGWGGA
jgi:hypothetical protein